MINLFTFRHFRQFHQLLTYHDVHVNTVGLNNNNKISDNQWDKVGNKGTIISWLVDGIGAGGTIGTPAKSSTKPFAALLSLIQKSIPFLLPSQTIVGEYICIFKMYLKNSNFQIGRLYTFELIRPKEFPQSLASNKLVNFPVHYGFMVFTSSQNRRLTQYSAVKRQVTISWP